MTYIIILKSKLENKMNSFLKDNDIEMVLTLYGKGASRHLIDFGDHEKSILCFKFNKHKKLIDFLKDELKIEEKNSGIMFRLGGDMTKTKYHMIVTILNSGYSDAVMEIARSKGAKGGTILTGRGTGAKQNMFMGVEIDSEKDIILNLVAEKISSVMVKEISKYIKETPDISGVCFSLPVSEFVGLNTEN